MKIRIFTFNHQSKLCPFKSSGITSRASVKSLILLLGILYCQRPVSIHRESETKNPNAIVTPLIFNWISYKGMLPIRSKSVHDGISIPLNRRGRVTFRSAMQFNFRAFLGERDVVG